MSDSQAKEAEARLARELNQRHEDRLLSKRTRYVWGASILLLAGVGAAWLESWMFTLMFLVAALICLVQILDTNGDLNEVRNRPIRSLAPDFSRLRKTETTGKSAARSRRLRDS